VWPIKLGTNLTRPEIFKIENVGFQLPQKERITPIRMFHTFAPSLDLPGVDIPYNPNYYPSSRQSKSTRRFATTPSTKQMQMIAYARAMDMTHLKGHHDSTPWIWLRDHVVFQTCTYTINLPTHREFFFQV
jgi:hypothetical protein